MNPFDAFRTLSNPFESFRYIPEPSKELDGASIVHFGASKVVGEASKVLPEASKDQKNAFRTRFGHSHDQIRPDFDHPEHPLKAFGALERHFFASKGSEMPFEAFLKVSKGTKTAARGADFDTHVEKVDSNAEKVDSNVEKVDANVEKVDTRAVEFETKAAAENT